jgi:thiopurine S-methyltransferase
LQEQRGETKKLHFLLQKRSSPTFSFRHHFRSRDHFWKMNDKEYMTMDRWKERTALDLDRDNNYPHDLLTDFFGQCVSGDGNDVQVLIPLCGKNVDIKWLYDEGYCVYGVDASESALQTFFNQHNIKFDYQADFLDGFALFKSKDGRINLFCGDVFRFSPRVAGCQFDVVWDRGALMNMNVPHREKYVDMMRELLLPTGRILLSTFIYDTSKWRGPPYVIMREDVRKYFARYFHVNTLTSQDGLEPWRQEKWGIDWMKETGYMLSLKT